MNNNIKLNVRIRHESVPLFHGIPPFFSSKFVVNEINANPLRSQNALWGGGINLAESITSCWQTDWNQQHLLSFHGTWNSPATDSVDFE